MKKLIAFIIIISTLALVSCGEKNNGSVKSVNRANSAFHSSIETPSRILLVQFGGLYYYSIVDGQSYRFCFDPLCRHTFAEKCPSVFFGFASAMTSQVAYSDESGRFYFARAKKIYSSLYDASDLRLEYSLGDDDTDGIMAYNSNYIRDLKCYGSYVYFMYTNAETGRTQVLRYDTSRGKLEEMTDGENEWVIGYEIASDYVYLKMLVGDDIIRYYTVDMDFDNRKVVENPISPESFGVSLGVYDGKYFYGKNRDGLYRLDPVSDKKELITNSAEALGGQVMAVDGHGVYFISGERTVIGEKEFGGEYVSENNKICRISFDGAVSELFSMPEAEMLNLCVVHDGIIVNCGIYMKTDERIESKGGVFIYIHFDDSGYVKSAEIIGKNADEEVLKDYFNGLLQKKTMKGY